MQELEKINEFSGILTFVSHQTHTISEILSRLNLEEKHFAVLVNGHKVDLNTIVKDDDEITVLPKIAGG
ncbi:MoaD/ThiS family protein [Candidatus Harpocratesius sp.]